MWKLRSALGLFCFVLLCSSAALVAGQRSMTRRNTWQTLNGSAPLVIAKGGLSGLFPESSSLAYSSAVQFGLPNIQFWCDVQLTRDGVGICFPNLRLENASNIDTVYPNRQNTYVVNGAPVSGWFSMNFTFRELGNITLKQGIYTRAPNFDNSELLLTVENVSSLLPPLPSPAGLWLSIPHDAFYGQHNLSMLRFVLDVSSYVIVNYISSPEVSFLRSIPSRIIRPTKLVFQFLETDDVEPTTNQTYGSLLNNLTFIRSFAAGIVVPKSYIWPVDRQYLLNYTSLVLDAHRAGLEIFASGFANDAAFPYDYSYDPVSEYLSFIDNGRFSVDGVLSDFPITPSATVDCFAHMRRNDPVLVNVTVLSNEGTSGDYPGCTDVAYSKAVSDGVDILDCPVQMTSDGIPICLGSINLMDRTDAAQSAFQDRATSNRDLNISNGIFAYNLTWSEIQNLKPNMFNPYGTRYGLYRNPRRRNDGHLMRLSDFLAYANNQSSLSGVLIGIENAAYLAHQGLGVTDAVLNALSEAGYNQSTTKRVMIRSSDSAVLKMLKSSSNYELVYVVGEDIRDVLNSTILEIKSFASSVVISKGSVFLTDNSFVMNETNVVSKLQSFDLLVYVELFRNEYVSQPWDFSSDLNVELNTHVSAKGINGVVTDFPATAVRYKKNRCLRYRDTPAYMAPIQPGGLLPFMPPDQLPPAEAPDPILTVNNVTEAPLPPVAVRAPPGNSPAAPGPTAQPSGQPTLVASTILSGVAFLLLLVAFVL